VANRRLQISHLKSEDELEKLTVAIHAQGDAAEDEQDEQD
jgi:hypothetical protein